jgi:hypothetical protein
VYDVDFLVGEWNVANRRLVGRLVGSDEPPVVGRFTDGRGEFHGDDVHDGTPIRVRYVWWDITPTSARWEQAFSADGGVTWETNWVMQFTRTG